MFRGISAAVDLARELVAELEAAVVTEAHLDWLLKNVVHGLHFQMPCSVVAARPGRPCSHTVPNPGRRATLAETAETTGCRWWVVDQMTVDWPLVKMPMDLRRRVDPSRGQNSP